MLQWGRDFSAAEMARLPWSSGPRTRSFNGAATFQPRKYFHEPQAHLGNDLASMGPRLFSRGNSDLRNLLSPLPLRLRFRAVVFHTAFHFQCGKGAFSQPIGSLRLAASSNPSGFCVTGPLEDLPDSTRPLPWRVVWRALPAAYHKNSTRTDSAQRSQCESRYQIVKERTRPSPTRAGWAQSNGTSQR
jgi:hypothetical protein